MKPKNNDLILALIQKRLDAGAIEHGAQVPLNDTRDHMTDSLEEALDLAVYLAAKIIEIQRRESKWLKIKRLCIMTSSRLKPKNVTLKCKNLMNSFNSYWEAIKKRMKFRT